MASTINAQITPFTAVVMEADDSGNLALQTNNVTALTINSSQVVSLAQPLPVSSGGTGATTQAAAAAAVLPTQTGNTGKYLTTDGANASWSTVTQTRISGGTTGLTPSTLTDGDVTLGGTLAAANGGTGLTSPGTSGNVLTSNGSGWASSAPAYIGGRGQVFTSTGTFTVPAGVTAVQVTVIGGGGGAGGSYSGRGAVAYTGGTGGTSSFGAYCSATGGAGSYSFGGGSAGGSGVSGDINSTGAQGAYQHVSAVTVGYSTGYVATVGYTVTGISGCPIPPVGTYGRGGLYTSTIPYTGAAGGGTAIKYVTGLTPGSTITVTVGAGGAAGTAGGPAGNAGVVIVEW